jgi:hypothetical protein
MIILVFQSAFSQNEKKNSRVGLGLYSDLFSLPLQDAGFIQKQSGVNLFLSYGKIKFKLNTSLMNLMNSEKNTYEAYKGFGLGFGYIFAEKGVSSTELCFDVSDFTKEFKNFNNLGMSLSVNFYTFRTFFIGTGIRILKSNSSSFYNLPTYNYNWFWRIGISLNFKKK